MVLVNPKSLRACLGGFRVQSSMGIRFRRTEGGLAELVCQPVEKAAVRLEFAFVRVQTKNGSMARSLADCTVWKATVSGLYV